MGNTRSNRNRSGLRRRRCCWYFVLRAPCADPRGCAAALTHQATYKLSLGHMQDLTLGSFAYLRVPLALAAIAFLVGAVGTIRTKELPSVSGCNHNDGAVLIKRRDWRS